MYYQREGGGERMEDSEGEKEVEEDMDECKTRHNRPCSG